MADPADLVREACTLLAGYMDVLERLVAEPSAEGPAPGMTGRSAAAPLPGNPQAFNALTTPHEGVRRLEAAQKYAVTGHPGRQRGGSAGNTAAALDAIPKLAAGLGEDARAATLAILDRWVSEARAIPAIDEAQQWRPLRSRACPRCGCFFLKVLLGVTGRPDGRVECFGHAGPGAPCRAAWARLADIVPELARADETAGTAPDLDG